MTESSVQEQKFLLRDLYDLLEELHFNIRFIESANKLKISDLKIEFDHESVGDGLLRIIVKTVDGRSIVNMYKDDPARKIQ